MGKVYAIKFQEVVEEYKERPYDRTHGNSNISYEIKFAGVKDHYYLKYLRCVNGSDFLSVSDSYFGNIEDPVCFTFNKIVKVVGYSADVPLIINVRGKDKAVLMPNYTGDVEMLPTNPLHEFSCEGRMGSLLCIQAGVMISIKPGV